MTPDTQQESTLLISHCTALTPLGHMFHSPHHPMYTYYHHQLHGHHSLHHRHRCLAFSLQLKKSSDLRLDMKAMTSPMQGMNSGCEGNTLKQCQRDANYSFLLHMISVQSALFKKNNLIMERAHQFKTTQRWTLLLNNSLH